MNRYQNRNFRHGKTCDPRYPGLQNFLKKCANLSPKSVENILFTQEKAFFINWYNDKIGLFHIF